MPNYKNNSTAQAMEAIRSMFDLAEQLGLQRDQLRARYSDKVYQEKMAELSRQFSDANKKARQAVEDAVSAAHERLNARRADALKIGSAEEDFKLLALPVKLSPDELRALVKRNEGNALFARAVAQYAEEHGYKEHRDLTMLAHASHPFTDEQNNIDEAGRHLMNYCAENRLDVILNHDWRADAFRKVDALGLFANL